MIARRFSADGTRSLAVYSDCERYRYLLRRRWAAGAEVLVVMLNPSTATERQNDPTIERCERRARRGGYGAMTICNLFGWRATRPADLRLAADPVGPDNDAILERAARRADLILCGWGLHGALAGRGEAVACQLRASGYSLSALGLTLEGHPRHPLYVPYAQGPRPWTHDRTSPPESASLTHAAVTMAKSD